MKLTKIVLIALLLALTSLTFGQSTETHGPQFAEVWHGGILGFHGRQADSNVTVSDHGVTWFENNGTKRRAGDNAFSRLTLQEAFHAGFEFKLQGTGACNSDSNPVNDNRFVIRGLDGESDVNATVGWLLEVRRQCQGFLVLGIDSRFHATIDGADVRTGDLLWFGQDGSTETISVKFRQDPSQYLIPAAEPLRLTLAVDYFGARAVLAGEPAQDGGVGIEIANMHCEWVFGGQTPLVREASWRQRDARFFLVNPRVLRNPFGGPKFNVTILDQGQARTVGSSDPPVTHILSSCNQFGQCNSLANKIAYMSLLLELNVKLSNPAPDSLCLGRGVVPWSPFILYGNANYITTQDTHLADFFSHVGDAYKRAWRSNAPDAFEDLLNSLEVVAKSRGGLY